jgi:hypothetical protein
MMLINAPFRLSFGTAWWMTIGCRTWATTEQFGVSYPGIWQSGS